VELMKKRRPGARAQAGFSLIEVLIAMLIAMVGLLGTVAVQQSGMNAALNVNDAQVAMRLAVTTIEQFNTRKTRTIPFLDMLQPLATGNWTDPVFLDAQGRSSASLTINNRWRVRTRVSDNGRARPYNISVEVVYTLDEGTAKTVQLDVERRKTW
jgi:prepilin-type N-terminal cleavage/methylation domain-containing protein